MTEVVPERFQGRIMAWSQALDGSMAALGAPLVGVLSEHVFGYRAHHASIEYIPEDEKKANMKALSAGMQWMTAVPWSFCFIIYSFLHCTYKQDVEKWKAQQNGLIEAVSNGIELQ